jgi:hypothetical protein
LALISDVLLFALVFLLSYEPTQDANVFALVLQEIEVAHVAKPQLEQVIEQRLLRNSDQSGRIFQTIMNCFARAQINPFVKLAPERHQLHYALYLPLLRAPTSLSIGLRWG